MADESKCDKCKTGCRAFCDSYTKREWRILVFGYICFYLFLTGWFSLHLAVMVSYLPEDIRASLPASGQSAGNGIINNGEFFSIREARSPRYQKEGIALARRATYALDGGMGSVPFFPWRECGQGPGTDCACSTDFVAIGDVAITDSLEDCSYDNAEFLSYKKGGSLTQQVRFLATYSSAQIPARGQARIKCNGLSGTKPHFSMVSDPYENYRTLSPQYLFTSPAPTATLTGFDYSTAVSDDGEILEITFTEGAVAPFIIQFEVQPAMGTNTSSQVNVEVECKAVAPGSGFSFEDDSEIAEFTFSWVNGWE